MVRFLSTIVGSNLRSKDNSQRTMLHHAALNGDNATVRLPVGEHRVDQEAKDHNGSTALCGAAYGGHDTTV
jgi:ankyrin repeat protein